MSLRLNYNYKHEYEKKGESGNKFYNLLNLATILYVAEKS